MGWLHTLSPRKNIFSPHFVWGSASFKCVGKTSLCTFLKKKLISVQTCGVMECWELNCSVGVLQRGRSVILTVRSRIWSQNFVEVRKKVLRAEKGKCPIGRYWPLLENSSYTQTQTAWMFGNTKSSEHILKKSKGKFQNKVISNLICKKYQYLSTFKVISKQN